MKIKATKIATAMLREEIILTIRFMAMMIMTTFKKSVVIMMLMIMITIRENMVIMMITTL